MAGEPHEPPRPRVHELGYGSRRGDLHAASFWTFAAGAAGTFLTPVLLWASWGLFPNPLDIAFPVVLAIGGSSWVLLGVSCMLGGVESRRSGRLGCWVPLAAVLFIASSLPALVWLPERG